MMTGIPIARLRPYVSKRAYSALTSTAPGSGGFTTVEEVAAATDDDLLDLRNFGTKSLRETRAAMRVMAYVPSTLEDRLDAERAVCLRVEEELRQMRVRVERLLLDVGNEGENEDGWSAHAVERVRELLGDEG